MSDPTVVPSAPEAPVVDTTPTLQPNGATTIAGSQVVPGDLTNEVPNPPVDSDTPEPPSADTPMFTLTETTDEGARTFVINVPTNYLELATLVEATISGFELANRNGVHNSVLDLNPGDTVVVPAPQLPVPTEAPTVDIDTATAQNVVSQNALGSIAAQVIDAQAGIDPGFAAAAAGVDPIQIPGGLAPSTAAVPATVGEVIEAPAGATIETGTAADGNETATIVAPVVTPPVDLSAAPAPTGAPVPSAPALADDSAGA